MAEAAYVVFLGVAVTQALGFLFDCLESPHQLLFGPCSGARSELFCASWKFLLFFLRQPER